MFLLILQILTFAGKKLLVYILCDLFIQSLYLPGLICCSKSKRVPFHYLLLIKERKKNKLDMNIDNEIERLFVY